MDTTFMEYTAEDLIAHKLQRAGILISKPKFDTEGADLLALTKVSDGARFCRIQCKGRSLKQSQSSSIDIPEKYVTSSFIVFLFIEDGISENSHLFCFFSEEIQSWHLNDEKKFIVSFTKNNFAEKFKDIVLQFWFL